jgi:hypothetical protein
MSAFAASAPSAEGDTHLRPTSRYTRSMTDETLGRDAADDGAAPAASSSASSTLKAGAWADDEEDEDDDELRMTASTGHTSSSIDGQPWT